MRQIAAIAVPFNSAGRTDGVALGPVTLRHAGLLDASLARRSGGRRRRGRLRRTRSPSEPELGIGGRGSADHDVAAVEGRGPRGVRRGALSGPGGGRQRPAMSTTAAVRRLAALDPAQRDARRIVAFVRAVAPAMVTPLGSPVEA